MVLSVILLGACADERQSLADWIRPPGVPEMVGRMEQQVAAGQVQEAIRMGQQFVAGAPAASTVDVHRMLARLLLEQGDAASALVHLQAADATTGAVVITMPSSLSQPSASEKPQPPLAQKPEPLPQVSATAGGATASVTAGQVEARAGHVSARVLP